MPEFRQNLATKDWIIIAAERAKRPRDLVRTRPPVAELPPYAAGCPFCGNNEGQTPGAVLTLPAEAVPGQWDVRVVPNKFPALIAPPEGACTRTCVNRTGPYLRRDGAGYHDVIIETPSHNSELPHFSDAQMTAVMQAYHQRYLALTALPITELVVIFRNHGVRAGTSIVHPHSQVVASSIVPFHVRNILYEGQRYYDNFDRCVYCDIIDHELSDGTRVIMENTHFVAISPYAASAPYEIWLLPRHHHATFGTVEEDELCDMGLALRDVLARLWRLLDDPDYNYIIDTAPEHMAHVPFYHWHLEIYPRLTTPAGFEIGSGIGINVVPPEQAAAELRATDGGRVAMA